MTGRRPKRSDSAPMTGEAMNCISAQTDMKMPSISAALLKVPVKCRMSFGSTGMMMPMESMSSSTVMKMKTTAGERPDGGVAGGASSVLGDLSGPVIAHLPSLLQYTVCQGSIGSQAHYGRGR